MNWGGRFAASPFSFGKNHMARRPNPPHRDANGKPGGSLPGNATAPDSKGVSIENTLPGTTLHLGDGRRLKYGESALVTPELAALLCKRGQAK